MLVTAHNVVGTALIQNSQPPKAFNDVPKSKSSAPSVFDLQTSLQRCHDGVSDRLPRQGSEISC